MPLHVQVVLKNNPGDSEVKFDLDEQEVEERFLSPFREGKPIIIGGRNISASEIKRIQIVRTTHSSKYFSQWTETFARRGERDWYIGERAIDVTDQFIKNRVQQGTVDTTHVDSPKVVFVVHGRNLEARNALFTFLRSIGLHPMEWSEAVNATHKPIPYVGEILEIAFSNAQAVVVLLTPDDQACLRERYRQPEDPTYEAEFTPQARANVIFEAGMAMGRSPDRTVLVELGKLRPFSDVAGRLSVKINNSTQRRQELAMRLQVAGCPVNLTGTDWHTAGNFDIAI